MENTYKTNLTELKVGMRVQHTLIDKSGTITQIDIEPDAEMIAGGITDWNCIPIRVKRDDGINDVWYENVKPL